MCTAIADNGLFGRTLDLEFSYGEKVVLLPRNYEFKFIDGRVASHYGIMGVAYVSDGYPLFYDAINEEGLAVAGLNFPGNAVYCTGEIGKRNVASFELIPWILCNSSTVEEAKNLLQNTVITNAAFSPELLPTPLHWIVSDNAASITIEQTVDGMKIYDNPFGVLTNNPKFSYHMNHITEYMSVDSYPRRNTLCENIDLSAYSRGMGGIGLPGDFSSSSRFVRSVFSKNHTSEEEPKVSRFFHIMETVAVPKGCVKTDQGNSVYSVYTSCADMTGFAYYFTTYNCRRIRCVKPHNDKLNGKELITFEMNSNEDILFV